MANYAALGIYVDNIRKRRETDDGKNQQKDRSEMPNCLLTEKRMRFQLVNMSSIVFHDITGNEIFPTMSC